MLLLVELEMTSKHISDEAYKRSLIGRELVPFFVEEGGESVVNTDFSLTQCVLLSEQPFCPPFFIFSPTLLKH